MLMKRNGDSEQAGVQKAKPDDTDVRGAGPGIELRPARHEWLEERGVHLVVEQDEMAPGGSQKRSCGYGALSHDRRRTKVAGERASAGESAIRPPRTARPPSTTARGRRCGPRGPRGSRARRHTAATLPRTSTRCARLPAAQACHVRGGRVDCETTAR